MGVGARAVDLELQRAAKAGNIKLVRQLLGRGARLCAQDKDGWTALHAAAAEGRASVIEAICSVENQGEFDVNALTGDGRTPLYFASLEGSAESVKLLLEHGANAHIRTAEEKGKDSKEVALLFGNAEVAAMLDEALALPAPEPRPLKAGARDVEGKASKRGGKAAGGKGGKEETGDVVDGEEAIRAKAEEYAARKPVEWKKSDFAKWGQMSDTDWEGLEAEYDLKATTTPTTTTTTTTTSKPKKNPPLVSGHFAADDEQEAAEQRGEGKAPTRQGYGSSKIGPPSGPQVTADHPRYGVLQEYKRIKAKWEEQKTNPSYDDELLSFKPPPEGGEKPNEMNGSHGPFYTWGQTPTEIQVIIEVNACVTKKEVSCDIRPEMISLLIKGMGGLRGLAVFHRAKLWRRIKAEESFWTLDGTTLTITMTKQGAEWWRCVCEIDGHALIDSTLCKGPDLISEYEGEAADELRQFFDKQLGKPLR